MATSICPKCNNSSFELRQANIHGARFQLMFVQCASCGAVVGVTEFESVPKMIQGLAAKLDKLK